MGLIKFWYKNCAVRNSIYTKCLKFGSNCLAYLAVYLNSVPCLRGDPLHREHNFELHFGSEVPS